MRRILIASTLFLAGCAARPQESPVPLPAQPDVPQGDRGLLTGLTPNELVTRLGTPTLQIREGTSLKLQFRNRRCVLDAYLYPTQAGQLRVVHVDARDRLGGRSDQAACVAIFENPI